MSTAATAPVTHQQRRSSALYRSDIHAWSVEQASALRRRDFAAVDWDNVIEEIDDLGRQERLKWTSHCSNVLSHFLKIQHFREARPETVSFWLKEIRNQRKLMFKQFRSAASLKSECASLFASAWADARTDAVKELAELDVENKLRPDFDSAFYSRDLSVPSECPYRMEHVTGIDLQNFDAKRHPSYSVFPHQISLVISEKLSRTDDRSR